MHNNYVFLPAGGNISDLDTFTDNYPQKAIALKKRIQCMELIKNHHINILRCQYVNLRK